MTLDDELVNDIGGPQTQRLPWAAVMANRTLTITSEAAAVDLTLEHRDLRQTTVRCTDLHNVPGLINNIAVSVALVGDCSEPVPEMMHRVAPDLRGRTLRRIAAKARDCFDRSGDLLVERHGRAACHRFFTEHTTRLVHNVSQVMQGNRHQSARISPRFTEHERGQLRKRAQTMMDVVRRVRCRAESAPRARIM